MENNQNLLTTDLHVDETAIGLLKETAKWAKFLAILGFIGSGFIVLMALFAGTIYDNIAGSVIPSGSIFFISLLYLVAGAINFFMSLFLYRFATKMKLGIDNSDQNNFNLALQNQKQLYKTMGIIAIVCLSFLALVIIVAFFTAILAAR